MEKIIRFKKILCLSLLIVCALSSSLVNLPANANIVTADEAYKYGYGSTKVSDDSGDSYTINIACDSYTEDDENAGRQVFNTIDNIKSNSNECTWIQTGFTSYTFDGNRSARITVSGYFYVAGAKFEKTASITLICNSDGKVSQQQSFN